MRNYLVFIFMLICLSVTQIAFSQTQEEIERMLNGGTKVAAPVDDSAKKVKTPKEKAPKEVKVVKVKEPKVEKVKEPKEKKVKEAKVKIAKEPKETVKKVVEVKNAKENTKSTNVIDQSNSNLSAKALIKKGDKLYSESRFYAASNYYLAAFEKVSKSKQKGKLNYKLGKSYFHVRDYALAQEYLQESLGILGKKKKFMDAQYYLGLAVKNQGEYEKAKLIFQNFIAISENEGKLVYEHAKARLELKGCEYALNLEMEQPAYRVKNAGENVNGPYADFGPELRNNELIFSKISSGQVLEEQGKHANAQLYSSEIYQDQFALAQNFSSILNNGDFYVCNPNFTADGKIVYFAKCNSEASFKNTCSIFKSELQNGIWTEPVALNASINEPNSSNSHPQIIVQEDGIEVLYFTSDRTSGKGGKDIWYAYKNENGDFGRARNMGAPINTKYDEVSPFYHQASNTFYFSSDGKASFGGLDIFKSERVDEEWSMPLNMDTPVNSSLDDYDFILTNDGAKGFLVSNRVGTTTLKNATCCDDIFELRTTEINLSVKGVLYAENKDGRAVIEKAVVNLKNLTEQTVEKISYNGKEFVAPLTEESDYELRASTEGFEDVVYTFTTKGLVQSDTLQYDLFFRNRTSFNNQVIGTIYYEYNQAQLTATAPKTLEQVVSFLKEYPNAIVEVNAHTDGNGDEAYNMDLSKGRCEAAVNYLTFNGVSKDRIEKHWYGESQPAASETNEDGSDNPDGRALNRRTEFKVKGLE